MKTWYIHVLLLERPIEVEEGEILSFHFANFTPQPHFVYILCLEETGGLRVFRAIFQLRYNVQETSSC